MDEVVDEVRSEEREWKWERNGREEMGEEWERNGMKEWMSGWDAVMGAMMGAI